jgi:ferrochelatase
MAGKKGVLIVNLGTPDKPQRGAVYRYLKQFLLDRRVIDYPWILRNFLVRGIIAPFRSGSSAKLYQRLWTPEGSPLKIFGYNVAEGVQKELGEEYHVELGMRYQSPSIESAIKRLLEARVSSITVFPMFPQYASATTGSVHEEVMRLLGKEESIPDVRLINSYYDHPDVVHIFADKARKYNLDNYDHFVFSFHGVPQRQLRRADQCNHCLKSEDCCLTISDANQHCYSAQCHATAFSIARELGLPREKFTVCFQSRLGPEQWTQPYTSDVIMDEIKRGNKNLLVFSPAFVADCLETTIEIGYEYKEEFIEEGGEKLDLVESLNDDPRWIKAISKMVR